MQTTGKAWVPAAGRDWLLPFYDPLTRLLGVEASHRTLIAQAALGTGHRVLEMGCGTGNLAILAKWVHPEVGVTGIDPDPRALARARRKADRRGVAVEFHRGFAEQLPYPDASFDRVLSAFMLHHVPRDARLPAVREARRVLAAGGSLHLVDFAAGGHHRGGILASMLHGHQRSSHQDQALALMQEVGLADAREVARETRILGPIAYYTAVRPR